MNLLRPDRFAPGIANLGQGTESDPFVALKPVTDIAAGCAHSLALRGDGTVWAWGSNHVGQLGLGIVDPSNLGIGIPIMQRPIQVPGLQNVIAIAAGCGHSLALKSDGSVWAWGENDGGVLGVVSNDTCPGGLVAFIGFKTPIDCSLKPLEVVALRGKNIKAISARFEHNVALSYP